MRSALAVVLALVLVALAALPLAVRADETPPAYDWGVVYFMSYDNDLERCGAPIIEGIAQGTVGDRIVAAVQADFTDKGGMRRIVLKKGGREETTIDSEDSADPERAFEYLRWFVKTFPCKRYVVTFLNHGGTLDAMCFDEKPATPRRNWMSGQVVGEKLRALKKEMPGRFELLFLQQCGRGSLENLYSFRGTADFIMSSPVPVGAPNTYYTAVHRWLAENPEATGDRIAAKIAAEDDHYTIYTCLRTSALDELPKRLDAAIAPFLKPKELKPAARQRVIHPVGEPIVDARAYLEALAAANELDAAPVAAFFRWVEKDLFTLVKLHEQKGRSARTLCGLSIYAPRTSAEAGRYRKLDIYSGTRLPALWEKVLAGAAEPAGDAPPRRQPRGF